MATRSQQARYRFESVSFAGDIDRLRLSPADRIVAFTIDAGRGPFPPMGLALVERDVPFFSRFRRNRGPRR